MTRLRLTPGILMAGLFVIVSTVQAKAASLPLTLDYPMVKTLVTARGFTGPGQTIEIGDLPGGCTRIVLSDPVFRGTPPYIQTEIKVELYTAMLVNGSCLMPIDWKGFVLLLQEPVLDSSSWQLSFRTIQSEVLDTTHAPDPMAGMIWESLKKPFHDYMDSQTINLAPPVDDLKALLMTQFGSDLDAGIETLLTSLKPGSATVTHEALKIDILADLPPMPTEPEEAMENVQLSDAELYEFIDLWEAWDDFLVFMITLLIDEPLTEDDRQLLLDTLLEARYRFVLDLAQPTHDTDIVREQFMNAWTQLSPLLRRHLSDRPGESVQDYLVFFTAMDALTILDRLGPALGIDISRPGLLRLARLIAGGAPLLPACEEGVNVNLRKTLGFCPILPAGSEPGPDNDPAPDDTGQFPTRLSPYQCFKLLAPRPAMAADGSKADYRNWIAPVRDPAGYVSRVRDLIDDSAEAVFSQSNLDTSLSPLFHSIVDAVAWQESCFRQFVQKNRKIEYLRSYNNTSVGLMQINERVWKGLYSVQRLRWEISYNARAGADIIAVYLDRYVLKTLRQADPRLASDPETVARLLYAVYNGGPSQRSKFLKRRESNDYYTSDQLFFEKFQWARNQQWDMIDRCLVGG